MGKYNSYLWQSWRALAMLAYSCLLAVAASSFAQGQIGGPLAGSVVICEVYADPGARSRLPVFEFIELKNVSAIPLNLKGWKISDGSSTAIINVAAEIQPDSFLLICGTTAANSLKHFGAVAGVTSFPTLNNDRDVITLYSAGGRVIHSIHYTNEWYHNDVKKDGGWTLEMIDTHNPCGGARNWSASSHADGGTPGRRNSVDGSNPDAQPPSLLSTFVNDSLHVTAVFDEPLDSGFAADARFYGLNAAGPMIIAAVPLSPSFSEVQLLLDKPLRAETVLTLTVNNIRDCSGNEVRAHNSAKCGLPSLPQSNDVVLNELLFNPAGSGYDYAELYNRSSRIVDLGKLMLASKSSSASLANLVAVSSVPRLLFPGEYVAVTENRSWVGQNFQVENQIDIIEVGDLPSLPDDKGYLAVVDNQGHIIDEISYSEKWHFALINNKDGVALERINYTEPTNEQGNWTSAASQAGYGTPGYQNSQFRADLKAQGVFVIEPKVFSPDNDGYNDVAAFKYEMLEAGYMGNITIYDAAGRPVRWLVKNALLGVKGLYNWDGVDEKLQRLPVGVYIVMMEVFNLKGAVKRIKNTITLARKF
jgi:lamin tail-like protein